MYHSVWKIIAKCIWTLGDSWGRVSYDYFLVLWSIWSSLVLTVARCTCIVACVQGQLLYWRCSIEPDQSQRQLKRRLFHECCHSWPPPSFPSFLPNPPPFSSAENSFYSSLDTLQVCAYVCMCLCFYFERMFWLDIKVPKMPSNLTTHFLFTSLLSEYVFISLSPVAVRLLGSSETFVVPSGE